MKDQEKPFSALIVRNLERSVKKRLQERALRHGRSTEEEVRDILRNAVAREERGGVGLGTEIAAMFAGIGLERPIPETDEPLDDPLQLEA